MEKYLHKCLDSLIINDEGMKQLEVLVINDGSKDSSSQIAHEYQDKYPNTFRVIDKENGNYGSCVNRGLKESTGKYIKILDADDYFDTQNFILYLSKLTNCNSDLIITDFNVVNEQGRVTKEYISKLLDEKIYQIDELNSSPLFEMMMHGFTYKKCVFDTLNYVQTEGISYTDQEWICMPMACVKTIEGMHCNVYQYLIGREGQTMDQTIRLNRLSHICKSLISLCSSYENVKNNIAEANRHFVLRRIVFIIKDLYRLAWINPGVANIKEIRNTDQNIQQISSEIFEQSQTITLANGFNYCFIKDWRSSDFEGCMIKRKFSKLLLSLLK